MLNNRKVLVVDDQEIIRRLIKMTLITENYQIIEAVDGAEALDLAREELPDLVLLDVMMPGAYDGFDVCRRMREIPEMNETVILFLSAKSQKVDKEEGIYAGANDYLVKPFSPEQLVRVINDYIA